MCMPAPAHPLRVRLVEDLDYFSRVVHVAASRLPAHLRGEAESEALVAMVEAADSYDESRGMPFRKYVATMIWQRMTDEVRKVSGFSKRTGKRRGAYSLDEPVDDPDGATHADLLVAVGNDPHDRAIFHERLEELADLPERQRIALTLDPAEAVVVLGVSQSRVSQLRKQARRGLGVKRPVDVSAVVILSPLAPQETRVLHLVAIGEANAEIAKTMLIGIETVKSHMQHILAKLEASNRAHAVNIAWEADWWGEHGDSD